ncbi:MAG: efflux RND transporter periplasmic adaptor subunit [Pseudomonadota bacterium]
MTPQLRGMIMGLVALTFGAVPVAEAQRGPASVFAETVETRPFATVVEAIGTLQPNEQVELALNSADRVTAIYFDDGQRVVEGQTLLSLAQREQLALVEAAEAEVEEARRQLERIDRLSDLQAVSKSELDQAQRDMDRASANLRAVQSRQKDRILVAPFDGVLGFRQVSIGTFLGPGDVVATLVDDSQMRMDFSVPSLLLRAVQPGTEVVALTDDLPEERFVGTVATIDNRIDPVTRAALVRAILPNEDRTLTAGMFMQVSVNADARESLAIPEESIESVGPEDFVYRVVDENGSLTARRVRVEIGARQDGYVEVTDGLNEGDTVITEGLIRVREGAAVVVRDISMLLPDRPTNAASTAGAGR